MITAEDQETFVAWARYLSWADLHRRRLDAHFEEERDSAAPGHVGRFITAVSHWYASLWVVAEGWTQLGLRDNFVDSILKNPPGHAHLLRRYRNGVYHSQPNLIEPRFGVFLEQSRSTLTWAHALHGEFIRVFWQYPERHGLSPEQSDEWRAAAEDMLGWLPYDSPYARITEDERQIRKIDALLESEPDTEAARGLREANEGLRRAVLQVRQSLLSRQQQYRESGWLESTCTQVEPDPSG